MYEVWLHVKLVEDCITTPLGIDNRDKEGFTILSFLFLMLKLTMIKSKAGSLTTWDSINANHSCKNLPY